MPLDTLTIVPSYATDVSFDERMTEVQFGDGYAQRAPTGHNAKRLACTLKYDRVTQAKAIAVLQFIEAHGATRAFLFTLPPPYNGAPFSDGSPMQFVFKLPAKHVFVGWDNNTVEVRIEQDFNPLP